jgi:hypothetical protein
MCLYFGGLPIKNLASNRMAGVALAAYKYKPDAVGCDYFSAKKTPAAPKSALCYTLSCKPSLPMRGLRLLSYNDSSTYTEYKRNRKTLKEKVGLMYGDR